MATGSTTPAVAEIDAAALHMARAYDNQADEAARKRWAGRIRQWASRYPDRITNHGRAGRRRLYDLNELQDVAARLSPEASAGL